MLDPKIERNSKCFFHIFADRLIDTKADWNHQATMRRIKEMENSLLFPHFYVITLWAKKKKIPVKIQNSMYKCTNSISHIIDKRMREKQFSDLGPFFKTYFLITFAQTVCYYVHTYLGVIATNNNNEKL